MIAAVCKQLVKRSTAAAHLDDQIVHGWCGPVVNMHGMPVCCLAESAVFGLGDAVSLTVSV
jgi:hypothetical protein